MNERLTQFLAAEQLTPTRFADLLGVQRSGISHILSGRNKPGYDFLEKFIKRFPSINVEWLITGRGKMYKEMNTPQLFPVQTIEPTPIEEPELFSDYPEKKEIEAENPPKIPTESILNPSKTVEKVVVFYTDKTFSAYIPE